MTRAELLSLAVASLVAGATAVEGFRRLPMLRTLELTAKAALESLSVLSSPDLSDRRKERLLRPLAGKIFMRTLGGSSLVAAWLALTIAVWFVTLRLTGSSTAQGMRWATSLPAQLSLVVVGVVYAWLCQRAARLRSPDRSDGQLPTTFSPGERTVHRVAFETPGLQEMLERVDEKRAGGLDDFAGLAPPVFVMGLARSGTTILLQSLATSPALVCQTYRNMPLVLAPLSWPVAGKHKESRLRPRAHGDGLLVSRNSPEAFEEVFWLRHVGETYLRDDRLLPQTAVDPRVLQRYRGFVRRVVAARAETSERLPGWPEQELAYLCKNNNNLLRMPVLLDAFPRARILIAFRHPVAHARSLLRQHVRFTEIHAGDPFARSYMDWLGHYEFGLSFRPFCVSERLPHGRPDRLEFWLDYWRLVYAFVLRVAPEAAIFVDHDRLRRAPQAGVAALAERLALPRHHLETSASAIRAKDEPLPTLDPESEAIYEQLRVRASQDGALQ